MTRKQTDEKPHCKQSTSARPAMLSYTTGKSNRRWRSFQRPLSLPGAPVRAADAFNAYLYSYSLSSATLRPHSLSPPVPSPFLKLYFAKCKS